MSVALWLGAVSMTVAMQAPQLERSSVRLVYASADPTCPTPEVFTTMVKSHLSNDPFGEPAGRIVLVVVEGNREDGQPLRARVEMLDATLTPVGIRTLTAATCVELANTAALQVAIAIEPLAVWGPAPTAPTAPTTSTTPPAATIAAPDDPAGPPGDEPPPPLTTAIEPAAATGVEVFVPPMLTLSGSGQLGVAGGLSTAVGSLGVGLVLRHDWALLRGELRVDVPSDDRPRTAVVLATIAPCVEGTPAGFEGLFVGGCATITGGTALRLENDDTAPQPYGGVGLRLTSGLDFGEGLLLRAFLQVEGRLIGGSASSSPLNALLGFQVDGELARW